MGFSGSAGFYGSAGFTTSDSGWADLTFKLPKRSPPPPLGAAGAGAFTVIPPNSELVGGVVVYYAGYDMKPKLLAYYAGCGCCCYGGELLFMKSNPEDEGCCYCCYGAAAGFG